MPTPDLQDVLAAGVVTFRHGRRVLLVHRPKYGDWSFPKGKLDPGEHLTAAAVREVAEETGLHVRLCRPLSSQRYPVGGRGKTVFYWTARVVGSDDVSGYRSNDEIDDVRWVPAEDAADLLTYPRDVSLLTEAVEHRRKTRAVVVLRHGKARSRKSWRGDDRERPLLQQGRHQADRLVPLLAAYGVTRVVSSSSLRCTQTVEPYADTAGWQLESRPRLSEEGMTPEGLAQVVQDVMADDRGTVVCSHRPVLPALFAELGLEDPGLELGEMFVAHVRKQRVVATERHTPA